MASRVLGGGLFQALCTTVRGIVITSPWLLHLFATDVVLSLLLPISFFAPSATYNISSRLAEWVWLGINFIFTRINGATITYSGSRLPEHESAIIVANHVSWTDFYMIQSLAIRSRMLGKCRYFAKQELKWVPFLGWGLWALGMPLISRHWLNDQRQMKRVFSGVIGNQWPIWFISFSEGQRYTEERHRDTLKWCSKTNRPAPKHCLYPRTKGFVTTVQQLRQARHIKAVYDMTLAYSKEGQFLVAPNIWQTLSESNMSAPKGPWTFHVHVDRFPVEDLPTADDELALWLEKRWIKKGDLLDQFKDQIANGEDLDIEVD